MDAEIKKLLATIYTETEKILEEISPGSERAVSIDLSTTIARFYPKLIGNSAAVLVPTVNREVYDKLSKIDNTIKKASYLKRSKGILFLTTLVFDNDIYRNASKKIGIDLLRSMEHSSSSSGFLSCLDMDWKTFSHTPGLSNKTYQYVYLLTYLPLYQVGKPVCLSETQKSLLDKLLGKVPICTGTYGIPNLYRQLLLKTLPPKLLQPVRGLDLSGSSKCDETILFRYGGANSFTPEELGTAGLDQVNVKSFKFVIDKLVDQLYADSRLEYAAMYAIKHSDQLLHTVIKPRLDAETNLPRDFAKKVAEKVASLLIQSGRDKNNITILKETDGKYDQPGAYGVQYKNGIGWADGVYYLLRPISFPQKNYTHSPMFRLVGLKGMSPVIMEAVESDKTFQSSLATAGLELSSRRSRYWKTVVQYTWVPVLKTKSVDVIAKAIANSFPKLEEQ